MIHALLNTLLVTCGAAFLAVIVASCLAILLTKFRVARKTIAAMAIGSFFLVPLYVQAGGWIAGFGMLGWWTLTQFGSVQHPWNGTLAVIWIHAVGALPSAFLIIACGQICSNLASEESAYLDRGLRGVVVHAILPKLWIWIAIALGWVACTTNNDMLITNLYQVPTMTEQLYLDATIGQIGLARTILASSPALLFGILGGLTAWYWLHRKHVEIGVPRQQRILTLSTVQLAIVNLFVWTVVGITVALPIANLFIKSAWISTPIEGEGANRSWSMRQFIESISQVRIEYGNEIQWTIVLAVSAATVALISGLFCVFVTVSSRNRMILGIAIAAMLMALPGPAINLGLIQLFNLDQPILIWLRDRTLAAPILALQSRCLPVVYVIGLIAFLRVRTRYTDLAKLDALTLWSRFWKIELRACWPALAVGWFLATIVAVGDLSTYLLVVPPQVTTIAMRIFELLHYGVRYREAGLCLTLAFVGMIASGCLMLILFRTNKMISDDRMAERR